MTLIITMLKDKIKCLLVLSVNLTAKFCGIGFSQDMPLKHLHIVRKHYPHICGYVKGLLIQDALDYCTDLLIAQGHIFIE